jgi:hypothetical protein
VAPRALRLLGLCLHHPTVAIAAARHGAIGQVLALLPAPGADPTGTGAAQRLRREVARLVVAFTDHLEALPAGGTPRRVTGETDITSEITRAALDAGVVRTALREIVAGVADPWVDGDNDHPPLVWLESLAALHDHIQDEFVGRTAQVLVMVKVMLRARIRSTAGPTGLALVFLARLLAKHLLHSAPRVAAARDAELARDIVTGTCAQNTIGFIFCAHKKKKKKKKKKKSRSLLISSPHPHTQSMAR